MAPVDPSDRSHPSRWDWPTLRLPTITAARYRSLVGSGADAAFCLTRRGKGPLEIAWWEPAELAWSTPGGLWSPGEGGPEWLDPICLPAFRRLMAALDRGLPTDETLRTRQPGQREHWWRCWLSPLRPPRSGRQQRVMGLLRDITADKERHDRAQAVRRAAVAALSDRGESHVYATIHRILGELMPVRGCGMGLLDASGARLRFAFWRHPGLPPPDEAPLDEMGPLREVVTAARPSLLAGMALREAAASAPSLIATDASSWLAVPLADHRGAVGVALVDSPPDARPLDGADRDTLAMVSGRLTRLVRLRAAERDRERYLAALAALHELSLRISTPGPLDEVFDAVVDAARSLTHADSANLSLVTADGEQLELVAAAGAGTTGEMIPASLGVRGRALASGRPYMVADYARWPRRPPSHAHTDLGRVLAVPLRLGDRVLGTLDVRDTEAHGYWPAEDVRLLTMFAGHAALAIDNAALLEQAQRDADLRARLLDEVNHRVKNNLSMVMGLLYSAREALPPDPSAVALRLSELVGAVRGLAEVHALLSANAWQPVPLAQLAGQVVRSAVGVGGRRLSLHLDVRPSDVRVDADQAQTLALVLNELATDSAKHGAAARSKLAITIWSEETSEGVRLVYTDDGPGCDAEAFAGVGARLVQDLVRDQLGGTLDVRRRDGFFAEISFPRPLPAKRVFTPS